MTLAEDILKETEGKICRHCLGRKLSKTIEGSNNIERADKVCAELDIDLNDVDCVVCDNLFDKLGDELYDKIDAKINQLGVEFDTFLVGCQIDKDIQKRDRAPPGFRLRVYKLWLLLIGIAHGISDRQRLFGKIDIAVDIQSEDFATSQTRIEHDHGCGPHPVVE
jgi:hypothetical protein